MAHRVRDGGDRAGRGPVARGRAATKGSADVVVVPARATGRLLLGCVNPLNWLKVLLGACASLTVGALTGAVIAAARWVAIEGPEGALAAARSGAWAHAPSYGAVFACYLLLSGVGRTHERRALALYRRTRRLPEVALVAMTVLLVAASLALALAGPRSDVGFVRGSDGLGWVPPGLRTVTDGLRDDIVNAELDGVTRCLSGDQSGLWTYGYTAGNGLDELDVATLAADPARAPDQRALATAALAVHNHLAPWVEAVTGHRRQPSRSDDRPPRPADRRTTHQRERAPSTHERRTRVALDGRADDRHR